MSWLPDLVRSFTGAALRERPAPRQAEAPASGPRPSADPRDRRTSVRHETEVPGRVRLPTSEHDCRIVDLSTGGMSVRAPDAAVSVGQQVAVITQNFPRLAGTVRWTREGLFGVQFAKAISAELIEKMGRMRRRVRLPRAPRARTELPGTVYFDGTRHEVIIGNISVGGLMLTARAAAEKGEKNPIRRGQPLMIEFAEMLPIGGHVRWTLGEKCGVMFSKPLALSTAEELQRIGNLSPAWLDDVRQSHSDLAPR